MAEGFGVAVASCFMFGPFRVSSGPATCPTQHEHWFESQTSKNSRHEKWCKLAAR